MWQCGSDDLCSHLPQLPSLHQLHYTHNLCRAPHQSDQHPTSHSILCCMIAFTNTFVILLLSINSNRVSESRVTATHTTTYQQLYNQHQARTLLTMSSTSTTSASKRQRPSRHAGIAVGANDYLTPPILPAINSGCNEYGSSSPILPAPAAVTASLNDANVAEQIALPTACQLRMCLQLAAPWRR